MAFASHHVPHFHHHHHHLHKVHPIRHPLVQQRKGDEKTEE